MITTEDLLAGAQLSQISFPCPFHFIYNFQQVLPVLVFQHRAGNITQLTLRYPALTICYSFKARYLQTLTLLYDLHEDRCVCQRVVCSRVQPGKTSLHRLNLQFPAPEELLVHRGYLKLTTRRRLYALCYINNLVRIEIEPDNSIVRFRVRRFLLDAEAVSFAVELRHTVALGIIHPVSEHCCL